MPIITDPHLRKKHTAEREKLVGRIGRLRELLSMYGPVPQEWLTPMENDNTESLDMVTLDKVEAKSMEWLWQDRIPIRGTTVIAGEGGVGKTYALIDIAARITRGQPFPDGAKCQPGSILYFSAEDDPETVLRPRFEAHGADCRHVIIQGQEAERMLNLSDKKQAGLKLLEREIAKRKGRVRMVVFDPITAFMGDKDMHRDNEVRSVFRPLTAIAQKHDLAVVAIMHFGKDVTKSAKHRTLGSVAFINAARAAWAVGKQFEEDEVVHFLQTKRNYTKAVNGLSFTIRETNGVTRVVWDPHASKLNPDGLGAGSRTSQLEKLHEWAEARCQKQETEYVTDAELQQSGRSGTRGNPDYCRQQLEALAEAGLGTVKQIGRKLLAYYPNTATGH